MSENMPDLVTFVDDGLERRVTVADFLKLPLRKRVQLILANSVHFFHAGKPIDAKLALAALGRHARG
jgi:hypothetical protein